MHIARIIRGRTSLSFFAQVRLVFSLKFLIDGSYYPWTYSQIRARPSYYLSVCNLFKERLPCGKRMQR